MEFRDLKNKIRATKDDWPSLTAMQQLSFLDELIRNLDELEADTMTEMETYASAHRGE